MKKLLFTAIVAAAATPAMLAQQSVLDALQVAQSDFRGTARYMSMGGAFTALGGDLSAITQNPAGIGIYRRSELGATVDLNFNKTNSGLQTTTTKFDCNNFGYVGVANLSGAMETFAWGVSYNRRARFDRVTGGYAQKTSTSLSNYIASFSNGYSSSELDFGTDYNPYENDVDWLSALGYTSYLINPTTGSNYRGLYQNGTDGDALLTIRETGYLDEYNFNFGGNIQNTVFWGIGIGVTDLNYTRQAEYSESMKNAYAYNDLKGGMVDSNAGFGLNTYKQITGTGWDLSLGLIFKPINELRIGASVHTPRWWNLTESYEGAVNYSYVDPTAQEVTGKNPTSGNEYTDYATFGWRLHAPWRFALGVAGVIGNNAIVSVDYERVAYDAMSLKSPSYTSTGWGSSSYYVDNETLNSQVHEYTRAGNIVRVGAEYRVTPQFSVRAGYNVELSNIKDAAKDGEIEVMTSGVDPSYTFNKTTQNISLGLGYRFGNWYLDGAYVYTNRDASLHAYSNFDGGEAPVFDYNNYTHSVVVSLGFKF